MKQVSVKKLIPLHNWLETEYFILQEKELNLILRPMMSSRGFEVN